jgi:hypothetical protein
MVISPLHLVQAITSRQAAVSMILPPPARIRSRFFFPAIENVAQLAAKFLFVNRLAFPNDRNMPTLLT